MSTTIPADGGAELIEGALRALGERLEELHQRNAQAKVDMENGRWDGLEQINAAEDKLNQAQDELERIATDFGIQARIIADARAAAAHAGDRDTIEG